MNFLPILALGIAILPAAFATDFDSDGDGLSDFAERHKYFTDPEKVDSDGDGKPDGEADERREYSYSIRTIVRVMRPYDVRAMNDDYQDARLLRETAEFGEFEIIHYPLNTVAKSIRANANWQDDYAGMGEWLRPGLTTNWTPTMRKQLLAELRAAGIEPDRLTDRELAETVSRWMLDTTHMPDYMFTTYFIDFAGSEPTVSKGCEVEFEKNKGKPSWTLADELQHEVLGAGMFANKTRGTCTSSAIYWTTIFRALGLPARQVLCIPAVDGNDKQQLAMVESGITHHGVRRSVTRGINLQGFVAHTFNEVFVGGRWVRLNYGTLGQNILDEHTYGLLTHTLTFGDLSEANLAATWGKRFAHGERTSELPTSNPFSTLEVSDRFGAHAQIPNPPVASDPEHELLTIDRVYWLDSPEKPTWLDVDNETIKNQERDGNVVALMHPTERFADQDHKQYARFRDRMDGAFTLHAPGETDIPAEADGAFFTVKNDCAFALLLRKADRARMKPGVAYTLVPANGKPTVRWAVQVGATLSASERKAPLSVASPMEFLISHTEWWHELPQDDGRRGSSTSGRDKSGKRHLLLLAEPPPGARTSVNELAALVDRSDRAFFLTAGSQRLPVNLQQNSVWGHDSTFSLEIVIEPSTYAAMRPGQPYQLEARNSNRTHWIVSASASVVRK